MKQRDYDKKRWGDGQWMKEPDRVEWRFKDLPCLIVRNDMGALCGYVGVGPTHPLFGRGYSDCVIACNHDDAWYCEHRPESFLRAHGGITFADYCRDDSPICHVARPGEPDPVFWFGFDCAHAGDFVPALSSIAPGAFGPHDYYKNVEYATAEVEHLAAQIDKLRGIRWMGLLLNLRLNVLKNRLINWIKKLSGYTAPTRQFVISWWRRFLSTLVKEY